MRCMRARTPALPPFTAEFWPDVIVPLAVIVILLLAKAAIAVALFVAFMPEAPATIESAAAVEKVMLLLS